MLTFQLNVSVFIRTKVSNEIRVYSGIGTAYFCKIIVVPDVSMHGMYYVCFVDEL